MNTPRYDVLINGGGPVGMGLAIELGQRGARVCVVERHLAPQRVPKGQNLTQRTAEHFRAWKCEDDLRAAHPIPKGGGIGGMTSYGTLLGPYNYDWLNRAHVQDYYFAKNARLPQYETEEVLRRRVARIASVDVLYGWTGTGLEQDESGVFLTISEASGTERQVRGRYLVGCDGAHSMVRQTAGIPDTRSDHDRLMVLLVFDSPALDTLLKRFPGKAFYNVLHPDLQGYWRFFGRVDHGKSWFFHTPVPLGTTRETGDFKTLLYEAVGKEFPLDLTYIGFWELRTALADTYRAGRVFIAGDAAHSHPPYGGFGINTGLEDARNLGWKLAARVEGWGTQELLDSYDAERRPVFASTARDFIERFIDDDRAFLETYNPEQDRALFESAWYARNLDADEVNAYAPNYAGSPLVTGPRGNGPSARGTHGFRARPGFHLPSPGPGAGDGVLSRMGSGFTLLSVQGAEAQGFQAGATRLAMPLGTAELSVEEARIYSAETILVRPDGFVAWCGTRCDDPYSVLRRAVGG